MRPVAPPALPDSFPVPLVPELPLRGIGLDGEPTPPAPVLNEAAVPERPLPFLVDVDPSLGHNAHFYRHVRIDRDARLKILGRRRAHFRQNRRDRVRRGVEAKRQGGGAVGVAWIQANVSQKFLYGRAAVVANLRRPDVGQQRVQGRSRRVRWAGVRWGWVPRGWVPRGAAAGSALGPVRIDDPNRARGSKVLPGALLIAGEGGQTKLVGHVGEGLWVCRPRAGLEALGGPLVPGHAPDNCGDARHKNGHVDRSLHEPYEGSTRQVGFKSTGGSRADR